ncbi:MAG: hypothetical protein HQL32_10420 [Planctomycetes bacterium]|nr:hypothetical protein [Planctomycetota bacterium]
MVLEPEEKLLSMDANSLVQIIKNDNLHRDEVLNIVNENIFPDNNVDSISQAIIKAGFITVRSIYLTLKIETSLVN